MISAKPRVSAATSESAGKHFVIVGGGFTGLAAAREIVMSGHRVTVLEADATTGGLAGAFPVEDGFLEKFYHHWFTNDTAVTELVSDLGLTGELVSRQSRTGMYYARSLFRLSRPIDLLKFSPLPFFDRIRLGLLVPQAKLVRDWRRLEGLTAREWLLKLGGKTVYRIIWEPLLRGKFGGLAEEIGAVWLWNKLCLRGGSRDASGNEVLLYYKGGFAALAAALEADIRRRGGEIRTNAAVTGIATEGGVALSVLTGAGSVACDEVLITTALPIAAAILAPHLPARELQALRAVRYLANVCLVLRLDRSLSSLYWINVNDPSFPFVGIIEHTNFEPVSSYGGEHIVYLSRYLPVDDPTYTMADDEYLEYALPFIQQMFPDFERSWLRAFHVWRAEFAQPVVERNYSRMIPPEQTSIKNVSICSMAQIYPEDRGTNYAIRSGRAVGMRLAER